VASLGADQVYLDGEARAARYADTAAWFQALGGGWWSPRRCAGEKVGRPVHILTEQPDMIGPPGLRAGEWPLRVSSRDTGECRGTAAATAKVRAGRDSPVEQRGLEPLVPVNKDGLF